MNRIQKLLAEWRAAQPIKPDLQHRMDQSFMIDFNYNSNHLEGNTLTYGQTRLLLLFGKIKGEALMRDCEEMKAHNVGLEMMKIEALDRERPLSESFIRELNSTILAGDFFKVSSDGQSKYKIHTGVYKTRPNSVITPSGEMFDYASPEETPSMMGDLVRWYNDAEQAARLTPVELAALFHYRYIRIHPFEDGNGRIARLLVNYILLRHGYPMIVILNSDRRHYLDVLGQCDDAVGREPYKGADATLEQIKPFVDYIAEYVVRKIQFALDTLAEINAGFHNDFVETDNKEVKGEDASKVSNMDYRLIEELKFKPSITAAELAKMLNKSEITIKRYLKNLQKTGKLERIGSDKTGTWKVIL
ncbi:MAG: Fic family protein [Bacteroidales bacterium]|jgi:Fic family protein|nr:Fic family protein [Bacteroidales bacterium]